MTSTKAGSSAGRWGRVVWQASPGVPTHGSAERDSSAASLSQPLTVCLVLSPRSVESGFLREIPVLTLDVNEGFEGRKDRCDCMIKKVKLPTRSKPMSLAYRQRDRLNSGSFFTSSCSAPRSG